jgi:hypothetical protein
MTHDRDGDDTAMLGEISRQLPAIDVDTTTGERIARRARHDVGRGLSPRRFIEPIVIGVLASSVMAWAGVKLVELLG